MKQVHIDAADVAILVCTGALAAAQVLYDKKVRPLTIWESLWFQDRVRYYCGDAWPTHPYKPL